MITKSKVIVVMLAYNAEKTLKQTFKDIPIRDVNKTILVDDGRHDKTVEIARRIIIVSIKNYIKIKYYTLIYRTDFI